MNRKWKGPSGRRCLERSIFAHSGSTSPSAVPRNGKPKSTTLLNGSWSEFEDADDGDRAAGIIRQALGIESEDVANYVGGSS